MPYLNGGINCVLKRYRYRRYGLGGDALYRYRQRKMWGENTLSVSFLACVDECVRENLRHLGKD